MPDRLRASAASRSSSPTTPQRGSSRGASDRQRRQAETTDIPARTEHTMESGESSSAESGRGLRNRYKRGRAPAISSAPLTEDYPRESAKRCAASLRRLLIARAYQRNAQRWARLPRSRAWDGRRMIMILPWSIAVGVAAWHAFSGLSFPVMTHIGIAVSTLDLLEQAASPFYPYLLRILHSRCPVRLHFRPALMCLHGKFIVLLVFVPFNYALPFVHFTS